MAKSVTLPIEVLEAAGNDSPDALIAKQKGAGPGVQPVLDALGKETVVFLLIGGALWGSG